MATGRKTENVLPKPIPSLPLNQHTIHNRHLKHLNPQANHPRRPAVVPAGQTRYRRRGIAASGNQALGLVLAPLATQSSGSCPASSSTVPGRFDACRQGHAPKSAGTESDVCSEAMEDGDDYNSDQDIYSGNSQPTSPVASIKTTDISAASNRKRIASEDSAQERKMSLEEHAIRHKRQKLSPSYSAPPLSPAICPDIHKKIWAEIFSLLPPEDLGHGRRACKIFNRYLDDQNIWRRSRKLYFPHHPRPVFGLTEWEMLSLMWGSGCMLCEKGNKKNKRSRAISSKATSMVYWPFRVRCCKDCLEDNSTKEFAILSSASIPEALLSALPFGIVDVRNNWISNPPHYQPNIGLTKIFWNADIKDIIQRYEHAKEMGAEEEWLKGLESEGLAHKLDVLRIERFEKTRPRLNGEAGGLAINYGVLRHRYSYPPQNPGDTRVGCQRTIEQPKIVRSDLQESVCNPTTITEMPQSGQGPGQPCKATICTKDRNGLLQCSRPIPVLRACQVDHPAQRRRDIEARCLRLNPPLRPEVLIHMPIFQAAIKSAIPLDELSWADLKPKLLEQRSAAEKILDDVRKEEIAKVQRIHGQRKAQDDCEKLAKERLENEWNVIQAPVREKLVCYAAEVSKSYGGITSSTAPKFAADVLLHCRWRFYNENPYSPDDPQHVHPLDAFTPEGKAILETPTASRLTLDNMKFVYETNIKPLTERFRRELFLCNGCERNSRYYGFEAIIQHYSAKHTPFLGTGQVVLHWKADWPATSPFHPEPPSPRQVFPRAPASAMPQASAVVPAYNRAQNSFPLNSYFVSASYVPFLPPVPVGHYSDALDCYSLPQIPHPILPIPQQDVMIPEAQGGVPPSQADHLAKHARDVWSQLSGVKDLPCSVRIHAVITKTISHFQETFSFTPSLSIFISALNEKLPMKPIKNANGLLCSECAKKLSPRLFKPDRPFSFVALLQHFHIVHVIRNRAAIVPDWKTEMIKLPEIHVISSLKNAQGMDAEKYNLLQEVFPEAFPFSFLREASSESRACTAPKALCQGLPSEVGSLRNSEGGMEDASRISVSPKVASIKGQLPCIPEAMAEEAPLLRNYCERKLEVIQGSQDGRIDGREITHDQKEELSPSLALPVAESRAGSSNSPQSSRSDDLKPQLQGSLPGSVTKTSSAITPTYFAPSTQPATVQKSLETLEKVSPATSNKNVKKTGVDSPEKTAAERFLDNFLKMTEDLQESESDSNDEAHPHSQAEMPSIEFTSSTSLESEKKSGVSAFNPSITGASAVEDTALTLVDFQHLQHSSREHPDLHMTSSKVVSEKLELQRQKYVL
ncbi:hypothetical protein RUND412_000639 [Rhizina undulata]